MADHEEEATDDGEDARALEEPTGLTKAASHQDEASDHEPPENTAVSMQAKPKDGGQRSERHRHRKESPLEELVLEEL